MRYSLQRWTASNRKWSLYLHEWAKGPWKGRLHENSKWSEWSWRQNVCGLGEGCSCGNYGSHAICISDEYKCCENIQFISKERSHCHWFRCRHRRLGSEQEANDFRSNSRSGCWFQYFWGRFILFYITWYVMNNVENKKKKKHCTVKFKRKEKFDSQKSNRCFWNFQM